MWRVIQGVSVSYDMVSSRVFYRFKNISRFTRRWRARLANIHHRFGALARANRRYSPPFRRAGARASQIFTTVSARWRAPIVDIHHRFGALVRANRRYSPPFRRAGAR